VLAVAACGHRHTFTDGGGGGDAAVDGPVDDGGGGDANATDGGGLDAAPIDGGRTDASLLDASLLDGAMADAAPPDAGRPDAGAPDAGRPDAGTPDAAGVITGGPCSSGASGQTAFRIRWANGGGTAYPVYEAEGLPGVSAGAYGYQIGFTPQFVDTNDGGGLLLDSSDFVDVKLSTAGVAQIDSATLSIYGRSYTVSTSGSFSWQTFDGTGAAPTNLITNVPPYAWYSADMTTEISPGDGGVLIRIYAGPSSNTLAVNRIELCLQAR